MKNRDHNIKNCQFTFFEKTDKKVKNNNIEKIASFTVGDTSLVIRKSIGWGIDVAPYELCTMRKEDKICNTGMLIQQAFLDDIVSAMTFDTESFIKFLLNSNLPNSTLQKNGLALQKAFEEQASNNKLADENRFSEKALTAPWIGFRERHQTLSDLSAPFVGFRKSDQTKNELSASWIGFRERHQTQKELLAPWIGFKEPTISTDVAKKTKQKKLSVTSNDDNHNQEENYQIRLSI